MNKKRTKIVATISDKNCGTPFIRQLYEAGMDVVRINSAHLSIEGALKIIKNIRQVSDKIAILLDTKGPEIRTTICDAPITIIKDSVISITGDPDNKTTETDINVSLNTFADEVPPGSIVMIDDGELEFKVLSRKGNSQEKVLISPG
jgi:pyruvate kinase